MTGTDNDIEIITRSKVTTTVSRGFKVAVPADRLSKLLSSFSVGAQVNFTFGKADIQDEDGGKAGSRETLNIKCGNGNYNLVTFPANTFPKKNAIDNLVELAMPKQKLLWMLNKVFSCAANMDVRHYLNGVKLEIGQGRISVIGTDGHRLALCTAGDIEVPDGISGECIIPRNTVSKLSSLITGDGDCMLVLSSSYMRIATEDTVITAQLIDGKYPDWRRVVPDITKYHLVEAERIALCNLVRRVRIMSSDKTVAVRQKFKDNTLTLDAKNLEQESGSETLTIDSNSSLDVEVSFNADYLSDALNQLSGDVVKQYIHTGKSACVITSDESSELTYVVMPVRA